MQIDAFLAEFSSFLIGVTIVFVTLMLLIVLIISLSKVISLMESKKQAAISSVKEEADPVQMQPEEETVVDLTDELELVAVITAAIAASMGTTSDKLQVRSLRQVTRRVR